MSSDGLDQHGLDPRHGRRESPDPRNPVPWILGVSAGAVAFLVWILFFKQSSGSEAVWVEWLPALNATLNALSAGCLIAGYLSIRRGRREIHKRFMLTALSLSVLFLVSYVTYHNIHGDTPFPGRGLARTLYFTVLISHIALSVVALPLILTTLTFALRGQFGRHKRLARITLPIWLYVSLTGVVIFFFLKAYT